MSSGEHEREPERKAQDHGFREIKTNPRNFLVPVILLSLQEFTSYGYKLLERTAAFGFKAMNPGTLYRTLRQMEKEGLCVSEWDTTSGGGPARRVYSTTDAGDAYLDVWVEALGQYRRNMEAFFSLYTGGPRRTNEKEDQ